MKLKSKTKVINNLNFNTPNSKSNFSQSKLKRLSQSA